MNKVIHIKYCGGCNPHYDRVAFVNYLRDRYRGQIEFVPADSQQTSKVMVAVCGCRCKCVYAHDYPVYEEIIYISNEQEQQELIAYLDQLAAQ